MENNPFNAFIDLVAFDQKIFHSNVNIKKIEKEITSLENDAALLQNNLEATKHFWASAKKDVDEKELKMQELDQLERDKKKKLDNIENPKEYNSLKKEIEKIKQIQYELEPKLVESWNKLESAKSDYEAKKSNYEIRLKEFEKNLEDKKNQIKILEDEIAELNKKRPEKEKIIPVDWINKYNLMKLKVSNPVAPVVQDSCNACFYHLTSQDLINLRHKKLMQCKRCYRFLYLPE